MKPFFYLLLLLASGILLAALFRPFELIATAGRSPKRSLFRFKIRRPAISAKPRVPRFFGSDKKAAGVENWRPAAQL